MSEPEGRVQEALAAHLEHLELGGPAPDLSHLSPTERAALEDLVGLLDQTEGVAFGRGLEERAPAPATTEAGRRLVALLGDALPTGARISADPAAGALGIPGVTVTEGFVVGTFGGRIRVWLLGEDGALASSDAWLRSLDRAFRQFPDTAALALVEPSLSCLLVQPEDCAPAIEVPEGALSARRYRRPLQPAAEAVAAFLRELIPHWEPLTAMSTEGSLPIDVPAVAAERAAAAVEEQAAAGARARKANPKRRALSGLGDPEAAALAELTLGVAEGRVAPEAVEQALREMARR